MKNEIIHENACSSNDETDVSVQQSVKKPIYKKRWFWLIIICVLFSIIVILSYNSGNKSKSTSPAELMSENISTGSETTADKKLEMEKMSALVKAKQYLRFFGFSKSGLIDRLASEGFSMQAAEFAVTNCGANWKKQATKKAQEYIAVSSFSQSELTDQLIFEGFTAEEAEYGATAAVFNY